MTAGNPFKALCLASSALCAATAGSAFAASTTTPIQHVIVVVGENHTFDNLFGTYRPGNGQRIDNLLSKGIVNWDGTPGRTSASRASASAATTRAFTG